MLRTLLLFTFLLSTLASTGQTPPNQCAKTEKLFALMNEHHVSPKVLDDSLSADIFNNLFHLMDDERLLFTQQDIEQFISLKHQIDDYVKAKNCSFLDSLVLLVKNRTLFAVNSLDQLTKELPDFNKMDTVKFGFGIHRPYAHNEVELVNRWRRKIKFMALSKSLSDTTSIQQVQTAQDLYKSLGEKQIQKITNKRIRKADFSAYVYHKFLQAIALSYDPHSSYFSFEEHQKFETSNATDAPSFGIGLEEGPGGQVSISNLIPGGNAWKTRKLNEGDLLMGLKDAVGNQYDLTYYDRSEILALFNSISTQIELTVQKITGEKVSVHLQKELLRADENTIKSLILTAGDKSIAYINFPGFYTKDAFNTSGCANDLAQEIIKLKKENIDGILLDVRNNGGGDMIEALHVAGIFIDKGTLSIYRQNQKDATLKDMNLGTVYDGPLVLMINGASASASELLAAALQDNNRAIIVGSPTFGKATGQMILPIFPQYDDVDFLKVTTLKFYRITGRSHQKDGIMPNVYLPDIYELFSFRENTLPFALPADATQKKAYYYPLPAIKLNDIVESSRLRLDQNKIFQDIFYYKRHLANYIEDGVFHLPIQKEAFLAYHNGMQSSDSTPNIDSTASTLKVITNSHDAAIHGVDKYSQEIYNSLIEDILEDPYVEESFYIISDYIDLEKL
jgi:carboxyl-terminal processing protease